MERDTKYYLCVGAQERDIKNVLESISDFKGVTVDQIRDLFTEKFRFDPMLELDPENLGGIPKSRYWLRENVFIVVGGVIESTQPLEELLPQFKKAS